MPMDLVMYQGERHETGLCTVTRDGTRLEDCLTYLRILMDFPRWDWGDASRGSHQLALALLLDSVRVEIASTLSAAFCNEVIAKFDKGNWVLTRGAVIHWVGTYLMERENVVYQRRG